MVAVAVPSSALEFTCPVIGPRVYITKGPSGWNETFRRELLDKELAAYTSPAPISDLVDLFIAHRELAEKKVVTDWHTVVGFLGRTLNAHPNAIPHTVAIAFWAHVVLATIDVCSN